MRKSHNGDMFKQAERILDAIGDVSVARITGRSLGRVKRWRQPKSQGGTDGLVPSECLMKIWQAHCQGDLDVTSVESLFFSEEDSACPSS